MTPFRVLKTLISCIALSLLVACGGSGDGRPGGGLQSTGAVDDYFAREDVGNPTTSDRQKRTSIFDALRNRNTDTSVNVNKYIWNASLEVLNFLPVQSIDPFTGVIITGYGTPPGGGRAYRATVHVKDPALEARSLIVALQSRSGTVSTETLRAVEDAILARARQLRIADRNL